MDQDSNITPLRQVQRAAQMPLRYCLASKTLENGKGMAILARRVTSHLAIGGFLIDLQVGIPDTYFRIDDEAAFRLQIDAMGDGPPMISVDPGCVRKRLREIVAWLHPRGSLRTAISPSWGNCSAM
jgi:hypothetical protein